MLKRITLGIMGILLSVNTIAQVRDSFYHQAAFLPHFHYSYVMPKADFGERYGNTNAIGLGLTYKTKTNWLFDVEYNSFFGSSIKENVLDNLFASGNGIINTEGVYENIKLFQRGSFGFVSLGKLIPLNQNKNSGILVKMGAGYLQHKIKFIYNEEFAPVLAGDRYKGYDRLTNGFATYQFVGYQILDPGKMIDFYIGFDFIEGFTKSRRSWDWDRMAADTRARNDIAIGLRIGLIMPFYLKDKNQEIVFD